MGDIVIRVENLSKRYRIGEYTGKNNLREAVVQATGATLRRLGRFAKKDDHQSKPDRFIWALRDVSFEVREGEVLGIIGRNGAGKSTLLKVLSRITKPTGGSAEIYGRVGSLLEVGTGFHSELTGRENIYLNGTILGMKRDEIDRKFDEIVEFSEIEKFLDTPVKRYSSGMYVRLAFAVAAHLEPEIIMVDEVLAVGDAAFQKKCLGKMSNIAKQGRTVLFVSHNMSAIVSLCNRCILLDEGSIKLDGDVSKAIVRYLSEAELSGAFTRQENLLEKKFNIDRAWLLKNNHVATAFNNSETLLLRIQCSVKERIKGAQVAFELLSDVDECIFSSTSQDQTLSKDEYKPGIIIFECPIDLAMLRPGSYRIKLSSSIPGIELLDIVDQPLVFELFDDSSPVLKLGQNRRGVILPRLEWKIITQEQS